MSSASPWYAVRVRSRHEKVASDFLVARGFESYLPVYRCQRRWTDRIKTIDAPLFDGYFFCRFARGEMSSVLGAPGVVQVVGFGKEPAEVADDELAAVKRIVTSGLPASPWPYVQIGDKVRIRGGALHGLEGRLERIRDAMRVVVSVHLLQRSVAVEVDPAVVEPVN